MTKKIIYIVAGIILLLGTLGVFSFRIDLTEEQRYTLSDTTVKVLKSVKKPLKIKVYLEGDFPASFKQLRNETEFKLDQFKKINPKIDVTFIDPIQEKIPQDTLMAMGMEPSVLPNIKDGKVEQIVIFPYATIQYQKYGNAVPLIVQQQGIDANEQLNKSIENLEYNLVSNIKSMVQEQRKNVGILINQEELKPERFQSFVDMALENYNVGPMIPENQKELTLADVPILKKMDALIIAKPRKKFSDGEKIILDQYIVNGGKTLFMIDAVNAEMDTLMTKKKIVAYPIDINMNDFFFNYGIRLNSALVKDFKKFALLKLVTGEVAGNPQYMSLPWPYFGLGISKNNHPITKNINPVKFEFPTSIDTLESLHIKKDILFESSEKTLVKRVPNNVDLKEIANVDSIGQMEKPSTPKIYAIALEGKFKSGYANRIESKSYPNFKKQATKSNKMIVIADGDVGRNAIVKGQALPLGVDMLTQQQFGNEQFLRNALDFLLDDENLMSLRNRNIEARLLDRQRITTEEIYWQWFNLLLPLLILGILGTLFFFWRRKKFR